VSRPNQPHPLGNARPVRLAALLAVNVFGAFCYLGIEIGLRDAGPLTFGGTRALIGGSVLLGVAAAARQPMRPARSDLGPLVGLGLLATTLTYGAMFGSPALMEAGLASVLGNLQPLVIVALGAAVLHEPLTPRKLLALGVGFAGVLLIVSPTFRSGAGAPGLGAALALVASAGAAGGSILIKLLRLRTGLVATTGWQLLLGSVPLLAAGALLEGAPLPPWSDRFWAVLLGLALLGTAVPTTLWFWLLRDEDAGDLAPFLFLTPALALVVDVAWMGGSVTMVQTAGVFVVLGALLALSAGPAAREAGPRARVPAPRSEGLR
jgi:probable blue pigment (indigoidine) exporter